MFSWPLRTLNDFFRARLYEHGGRVYAKLRRQALSINRVEVGIPAPPFESPVWGALMEVSRPTVTATLLALIDGTTSIYRSTGGGVIGGESHESVREANARFIGMVNQYRQYLTPSKSFPMGKKGQILFYALTDSGVLVGGGTDEDLPYDRNPLSPLFHEGHGVITQLRLIAERS